MCDPRRQSSRDSGRRSKSLATVRACLGRRGVLLTNAQTALSHLIIEAVTNGLTAHHQQHKTGDEASPLRARSSGVVVHRSQTAWELELSGKGRMEGRVGTDGRITRGGGAKQEAQGMPLLSAV